MGNWSVPNGDNKINIKKALRKKKALKILNICSYICSGLFLVFLVIALCGSCSSKNDSKEPNNVVERYEPHRAIYDDSNYVISFSNGDIFNFDLEPTDSSPLGVSCSLYFYDESDEQVSFVNAQFVYFEDNYFEMEEDNNTFSLSFYDEYMSIAYNVGGVDYEFNAADDVNLELTSSTYESVALYFEQHQVLPSPIDESIFSVLTSSVSNFIVTLGSGITAVLGLFWANNSLTVLGTLTVVVVAVAVAYFLFRFVIGLVRLRG